MNELKLWQPEENAPLIYDAKSPSEISQYALQLSKRDKRQIVSAFEDGHYEMAITYLWDKTISALKKELSTVGVSLLGEMLGKPDVDEDDDVDDILTAKDTIVLAEQLGAVSKTTAMRLRQTHELISHFSSLEINESDEESIDESEAISSLKNCIRGVLGRPKVVVAQNFVEFRNSLEKEKLSENDDQIEALKISPYFFIKLTVSVLINAIKRETGARLETALANTNLIIPAIWSNLRETEKWHIGYAYAEMFSEGNSTAVNGLKRLLLKVKGFDYVPENLRSNTFLRQAQEILKAHDGMNNFYNEVPQVKKLYKIGTTIPTPAIPACFTALLCVYLGNTYGHSWHAQPYVSYVLDNITNDRWEYYLDNVLPGDIRILNKLMSTKPRSRWLSLTRKYNLYDLDPQNRHVKKLLTASKSHRENIIREKASDLISEFYGE